MNGRECLRQIVTNYNKEFKIKKLNVWDDKRRRSLGEGGHRTVVYGTGYKDHDFGE